MSSGQRPGEFQLIQRVQAMLARQASSAPPPDKSASDTRVISGIGDDCAVLQGAGGKYLLVTTDMLVEGVHFSRAYSSLRQIGQKAMIVNLSDIAAMGGGEPGFAFISLALPASFSMEDFDALWQGLIETAQKFSFLILGGDTNASFPQADEQGLVINITLIGEVCPEGLITRQGACEGDLVLLTGRIGDSAAGLDLLRFLNHSSTREIGPSTQEIGLDLDDGRYQQAMQRHRVPALRLAESRIISQHHLATAMIDVSDGLAGDLRHLCRRGKIGTALETGAVIWSDRLPISKAVVEIARLFSKSALSYALCGGEDYELLFTATPDRASEAKRMIEQATGTPVSIIGEITEKARGIQLIDEHGQTVSESGLEAGFDHFRK